MYRIIYRVIYLTLTAAFYYFADFDFDAKKSKLGKSINNQNFEINYTQLADSSYLTNNDNLSALEGLSGIDESIANDKIYESVFKKIKNV